MKATETATATRAADAPTPADIAAALDALFNDADAAALDEDAADFIQSHFYISTGF